MFAKKQFFLTALLLLTAAACASGSQNESSNPQAFSVSAINAVSVKLEWAAMPEASGYTLEAKFGSGDFFEVAQLGGDQTAYTHFVVPNSPELSYQLSAVTGAGTQPIGTASAIMPELAPNPIVITEVQPFAPAISGGLADFISMPTIDPFNPDPNAMATLVAMSTEMSNTNPEDLIPEIQPLSVTQTVGPAGGTITLTDPNGVAYALEVPAGVVEDETTFKLGPVESIGGLPFQHLLAAVDIFPPIPFYEPLKLRITLPDESSAVEETLVAFIGSKSNFEFSMTPVYQDGNDVILNVYWGDLVGIAVASQEEIVNQALRVPTDGAEQVSQTIAVLQALSEDLSPEGTARIFLPIIDALIQQSETTGGTLPASRVAAPAMQSESGTRLWRIISTTQRLYGEGRLPYGTWSGDVQTSWQEQWRIAINNLVIQISAFLATHTGCRTRDELYAEALVALLKNPENEFQVKLAERYTTMFGNPEALKDCDFQLRVDQSTIEFEDQGGRTTAIVHLAPFHLEVIVRGEKITLRGIGPITYDHLSNLWNECPPEFDVTPPDAAIIWITDLSPIFDEELRVVDLKLLGIQPDPVTGLDGFNPLTSVNFIDPSAASCQLGSVRTKPWVDMWGLAMAGMHNLVVNKDAWEIVGEGSYVATNIITDYSHANINETTVMILTVTEKDE